MTTLAAGATTTVSLAAGQTLQILQTGAVGLAVFGPGSRRGSPQALKGGETIGPFASAQVVYLSCKTGAMEYIAGALLGAPPGFIGAFTFEALPAASAYPAGTQAYTTDQGYVYSSGSTWVASRSGTLTDASTWSSRKLLLSAGGALPASVYWPFLFKARGRFASPLADYYLYFSTDHDAGAGGIHMAHGPTPEGPFTYYGQVFVDPAAQGGTNTGQTETGSPWWDPYSGNLRMFYQQLGAKYGASDASNAIGQQSTLSCTSTDGIAWTKDPNFILDVPALADVHGNGHTGYFLPFQTARGVFAYGLYGGAGSPDFVLWRQNKQPSSIWLTDGISLGYSKELTQGAPLNARRTEWNSSFVVESCGVEYWIGRLSDGASGGAAGSHLIGIAPISADYRRLMSRPIVIWSATEAWETADLRSLTPYIEGGVLHLYYSIDGTKIGVMSHVL